MPGWFPHHVASCECVMAVLARAALELVQIKLSRSETMQLLKSLWVIVPGKPIEICEDSEDDPLYIYSFM